MLTEWRKVVDYTDRVFAVNDYADTAMTMRTLSNKLKAYH